MIDALICPEPYVFGLSALNELADIAFASKKPWRVDAIRQIHTKRPYRRSITDAKTNRVDQVVEMLDIELVETGREVVEGGLAVGGVLKDDSEALGDGIGDA